MLAVNFSALITYEVGGRPNLFHGFAVLNLATLALGWMNLRRFLRTRERVALTQHAEYMTWAYYGLAAAGMWQIVISAARAGYVGIPFGVLFNGLGVITALTSVALFFWLQYRSASLMLPTK